MRHEVPLEILDPFLFVARDDEKLVLTNTLEAQRITRVLPEAELLVADELGFFDLVQQGTSYDEAELTTVVRALRAWGVDRAVVARDLPVAVADWIRAAGIAIDVDGRTVEARRRVKAPAELAGIRRAQRAGESGMAAAEKLIREAKRDGGRLNQGGEPLTAEEVAGSVTKISCS